MEPLRVVSTISKITFCTIFTFQKKCAHYVEFLKADIVNRNFKILRFAHRHQWVKNFH